MTVFEKTIAKIIKKSDRVLTLCRHVAYVKIISSFTIFIAQTLVIGELSLDGSIKEVPGILPIVMQAKEEGCRRCIIPRQNVREGALIRGMEIIGAAHLKEICRYLNQEEELEAITGGMHFDLG